MLDPLSDLSESVGLSPDRVKTANEPGGDCGDKDFWADYGSGGEMMDH